MMTNTRMILKGFATHIASGCVLVKLALFHKNNYVRKGLSRQEIRTKILFLTTVLFINHPFKDIFKPWIYGLIRLKLSGTKQLVPKLGTIKIDYGSQLPIRSTESLLWLKNDKLEFPSSYSYFTILICMNLFSWEMSTINIDKAIDKALWTKKLVVFVFSVKAKKKVKMKFFVFLRVWSFEIFVLLSAQDTTMPPEFKTGEVENEYFRETSTES